MRTAVAILLVALATTLSFFLFTSPPADALISCSPSLRSWFSQGQFHNYKGYAIFYTTSFSLPSPPPSNLPTLVLIHGFPSSSFDFHLMWDELKTHFNLIAFDMLGFGFSDKPWPHDYKIAEQADMVKHLLRQLNVSRFHVFAHDLGVSIGQELMAQQQNGMYLIQFKSNHLVAENTLSIQSIVFLNGGLFPHQHRPIVSLL